jgi:hypothetical protein
MANVTAANTPAAQAALARWADRQAAREAADRGCTQDVDGYGCHCDDCQEQAAAESAAEIWAEEAWLRAAENDGHGYVEGCPCC